VDCYADLYGRSVLRTQLGRLYHLSGLVPNRGVG
jgi:hypothetical protein